MSTYIYIVKTIFYKWVKYCFHHKKIKYILYLQATVYIVLYFIKIQCKAVNDVITIFSSEDMENTCMSLYILQKSLNWGMDQTCLSHLATTNAATSLMFKLSSLFEFQLQKWVGQRHRNSGPFPSSVIFVYIINIYIYIYIVYIIHYI